MRMLKRIAVICMSAMMIQGCYVADNAKMLGGGLIGAAAGAYGGSHVGSGKGQLAAMAGGAVLGGLLLGNIGRSLDRADQLYAERATNQTLETARTGQTMQWATPSGVTGTVTPVQTYTAGNGHYCREYYSDIFIGGRKETVFGRACRQPDGSWTTVN